MNRRVVRCAVLAIVAMFAAVYLAAQPIRRGFAEAGTPNQLTIRLQLDSGEKLSTAAAGD